MLHLDVSGYKNAAPGGVWFTKEFFGLIYKNKVCLKRWRGNGGRRKGRGIDLRIYLATFRKNSNTSVGIIRVLGECDSWKKPEAKNLVALSFDYNKKLNYGVLT